VRGHFASLSVPPMNEVTRILSAVEQGDPHDPEQLLPLVYDELRKLAVQWLAGEWPCRPSSRSLSCMKAA
jgi:hypothetical protein